MNADNMNKVIDLIAAHPEHFDMNIVLGGASTDENPDEWRCGSSACVLGWALVAMHREGLIVSDWEYEDREVYQWLGLTPSEGRDLCFPDEEHNVWKVPNPYIMTAEEAVLRLRDFVRKESLDA